MADNTPGGISGTAGGDSSALRGGSGVRRKYFDARVVSGMEEDYYSFIWNIKNFDTIRSDVSLIKSQAVIVTTKAGLIWTISLTRRKNASSQPYVGVMRRLTSMPIQEALKVLNCMDVEWGGKVFTQSVKSKISEQGKPVGFPHVIPQNSSLEDLKLIDGDLVLKITLRTFYKLFQSNNKRKYHDGFQLQSTKKLRKDFADLLEDSEEATFSDVRIVSKDGEKFAVHKAILSARSPVFKAMFATNLKEAQTGVVEIADVSGKVLKLLLKFMYTGLLANEWKEDTELLEEFTYAVDKYQLMDCLEYLDDTIGDSCTVSNVLGFLELAGKLSLRRAEIACMKYLKDNRISVAESFEDLVKIFEPNETHSAPATP